MSDERKLLIVCVIVSCISLAVVFISAIVSSTKIADISNRLDKPFLCYAQQDPNLDNSERVDYD